MTGDSGTAPGPLALFCDRLKCLQQASGISQAGLARAAHLEKSQMSDILNGKVKRLPRWEITIAMVRASVAYAETKGGLIPEGLRDERDWRSRYADVEHDLDAVVRSGSRREVPPGWLLADVTDPFALEVHRPVQPDAPQRDLPVLPAYLPRDHDARLERIVAAAAQGTSGVAVLVGGSSTGKTRACWEALRLLRARPERWRLWHPIDPSRPEAVLRELPSIGPRTVIWLNEAQFYLNVAANGLGERVAAGMRELLRDPGRAPVLVLATLWPQYWGALTVRPDTEADPHAQARELLAGRDISVPAAFTADQVRRLSAAADPRLAQAAEAAEDGQVTQFLAGAPELMARYRNAPAAAAALISAAIDARRLGMGVVLPLALLEEAASGYLTDFDWDRLDEDWLEQALAYAAAPCRGARGPLTRIKPRPGHSAPSQPCYRLADYLEQAERASRHVGSAPAALWDALLARARREELQQIAAQAQQRGLYRYAFQLHRAAAEAGDAWALMDAARLLAKTGRTDEAIAWLRSRSEAGDTSALREAAMLLNMEGRIDEAVAVYQQAAEAGDTSALKQAARLLVETGRTDEAIAWLRSRSEAGDTSALKEAARLLEAAERAEEAIDQLRSPGDKNGLKKVARLLREAGRIDEAFTVYRWAARIGDIGALKMAFIMLEDAGRAHEVIAWLRSRGEAGDTSALKEAAWRLNVAGRIDEAITVYQQAAEASALKKEAAGMLQRAAGVLQRAGRIDEAVAVYQQAAEVGDTSALKQAVRLLEETGRADEAIAWLRSRSEAGALEGNRLCALEEAARLLREAGRADEAITVYQQTAEAYKAITVSHQVVTVTGKAITVFYQADDAVTVSHQAADDVDDAVTGSCGVAEASGALLAVGVGRAGKSVTIRPAAGADRAMAIYQQAAEAGDTSALKEAARVLWAAGRADEVITWLRSRTGAGGTSALKEAAGMLRAASRADEAITWLRSRAEAGDISALKEAAGMLQAAGRADEAVAVYLQVAEAGDILWAAGMLRVAGRAGEAARLRRYGVEPGGRMADPWEASDRA